MKKLYSKKDLEIAGIKISRQMLKNLRDDEFLVESVDYQKCGNNFYYTDRGVKKLADRYLEVVNFMLPKL